MKRREVLTSGANEWLAKLRLAYNSGELSREDYLEYLKWFQLVLETLQSSFDTFGSRKLFKPSVRYLTDLGLHRPTTVWASLDDSGEIVRVESIVSKPEYDQ